MPATSLPSNTDESNIRLSRRVRTRSKGLAQKVTYNLQQPSADEVLITLMSIYDKSEIENVSDGYLRSLVQQIERSQK